MAKTCVIGEADPFIGRLLRRFAEESGLQAISAQLGQEVLELVRHSKPEVIVLDAELPGDIRGWEAVRTLKSDAATSDIPVIICSWLSESEARALVGEMAGYLQKPELHLEDFAAMLKHAGAT